MNTDHLKELLVEFESNVTFGQDLKKKNWFNIGGKSKVFYKAENLIELVKFLKLLNNSQKIICLGAGSNTLIRDGGIKGITIKLSSNFSHCKLLDKNI